jgi:hypothetical protein
MNSGTKIDVGQNIRNFACRQYNIGYYFSTARAPLKRIIAYGSVPKN